MIGEFLVTNEDELGCTNVIKHVIDTGDSKSVSPYHRYIQKEVDKKLDRMIRLGVIESAESEWANSVAIARKSSEKFVCVLMQEI